ncbi:unnamed protein product [Miscanthus lutarioriparius]|uniref:Uncharacterized protein n=1 Tax=Miscanthus lutarioriparius TaxID=422564 RepID=A0A811RKV3_9POAL|nr:unnamed protein product [Miscanthus lutarioriparius]
MGNRASRYNRPAAEQQPASPDPAQAPDPAAAAAAAAAEAGGGRGAGAGAGARAAGRVLGRPMEDPQGPCNALAVLRDHAGSVSSLSLCGEFLLSASTGGDIVVWQQPDLRRFARFDHGENGGSVKALAASGGRVFSAHQDGRVRVWRVSRRSRSQNAFKLIAALPTARDYLGRRLWIEHADSISCLAVATTVHNAALLYSGSWDRTLKVWRITDLKCLDYILSHDDAVNTVAAGAGVVYSGSADGRVKAWEKGKAPHFLQGVLVARDGVSWNALAVAASDHRVYAAGSDSHIAGWDRRALDPRVRCEGARHGSAVPLRRQGPALHRLRRQDHRPLAPAERRRAGQGGRHWRPRGPCKMHPGVLGYDVVALASPERFVVGLDISDLAVKKAKQGFQSEMALKVMNEHVVFCVNRLNYQKVLEPLGLKAILMEDNELAIKPRKGCEKIGRWKRYAHQSSL